MKQRQDLDKSYLNTPFDRQARIYSWDQKKVSQQKVLILGVGGLGSILMMSLLRLGVKKLFILDRDIVDIHNLNRQIMYTLQDVGKSKVDSAIKNSKIHNVGNTQIEGFNGNALTNWQKIIQFAKQCDIIFNCIDHGQYFDLAVAALCLKLKIPLIMGGTYATTFTIDYFSPQGKPCYKCTDDAANNKQIIQQITPQKILQLKDLSFLPKNNNPVSQSSIVVCTLCGQMMMSHYVNYICLAEQNKGNKYAATRTICYHNTFEIIKFDLEQDKKCLFCGDPNYVQQKIQEKKNNQQKNGQKSQEKQKQKQTDKKENLQVKTQITEKQNLQQQENKPSQQKTYVKAQCQKQEQDKKQEKIQNQQSIQQAQKKLQNQIK